MEAMNKQSGRRGRDTEAEREKEKERKGEGERRGKREKETKRETLKLFGIICQPYTAIITNGMSNLIVTLEA